MSVTYIPDRVKILLWGKAAGRCQYDGCNKPLWLDDVTKAEFNAAYIAHIIADKPTGPRGDPQLSETLKSDLSNLMLMCDTHHRRIDIEDIASHPVELLRKMKRNHEDRVELLSSITEEKQSHIVLYGANIGEHSSPLTWQMAAQAMLPERYPAERQAIELSIKNSPFQDDQDSFWKMERENLRLQFARAVKPRLAQGDITHLSIFGKAPQPLLMELGRLLSDIHAADVYQLHREPPNWSWQEGPTDFEFLENPPAIEAKTVALNLSLSGKIDTSRITSVLGNNTSIWTMGVQDPNNDFMQSRDQLALFRFRFRRLLNTIKAKHGQNNLLHVFPCVPVSVAVEIGRVWMPKADLPMRVYDQNTRNSGFKVAFDIMN